MKNALNDLLNKCAEGNIEYADDTEQLSEQEVNEIMKKFRGRLNESDKPVKSTAGIRRRFILGTAAAAAIAVLVPTSVYAYNRYIASIEKTANYQNTLMIEGSDTAGEQLMDFEIGWIPDGFAKINDHEYNDGKENINIQFYKIPDNGTKIDMPWSADCKTYNAEGKTAMINYSLSYNTGREYNHGRHIWVIFDGTDYFLEISLPDTVSEEDALKIVDNAKLVPTDKVCYNTYLYWEDTVGTIDEDQLPREVDMDKCKIYKVGDTVSYSGEPDMLSGYSVTLNSVELTDSFDGIHTDACGNEADYSAYMDENGNVPDSIRKYIKYGDGVNTVDEVIKEENVPIHILKLNATIANISDKPNEIIISPKLVQFNDGNSSQTWQYYYDNGTGYGDKLIDSEYFSYGLFSLDVDPDKKGDLNTLKLEAGETAEVQLAFFAADDKVGNLYAFFSMAGNNLWDSVENGGCPLFDLNS